MARPKKKVDREMLLALAERLMTTSEIAAVLKVSPDTIERRYHNELIQGRELGKASVRRMQFDAAQKGNVTMLIWLGKQILGQKDQVAHSGDVGVTMRREEVLAKLTARPTAAQSGLPEPPAETE